MTSTATSVKVSTDAPRRRDPVDLWYVGAVVLGTILIIWAALNQPYNQNELQQIKPYGSDNIAEIVSGTRQPPLGPLLGGMFQHLLGVGQLQQRLVPVLSGIGTLIVVALLLRHLRLHAAGAVGLWVLATAPVMIRYSAYTRPYALPLFLMVLAVFAIQRWLDSRRWGWLVLAAVAALALPAARVPEPTVFLLATPAILAWFTLRGRFSWRQTWPPIAVTLGALALVGYPMYRTLATEASSVYDPSPSGIIERFPEGVTEIVTFLLPLIGEWFPWWPVTVLLVVAALGFPQSRRRLARWWFFWPLLAAPIAFVLAYHFINPFSFDVRPYRPRFLTFFVPVHLLLVVALATMLTDLRGISRRVRLGLSVLLSAVLVTQLPMTAHALLKNEAADYAQAAEVLEEHVPDDAIVLYDTPSPVGMWRQPFSGRARYLGEKPFVAPVSTLAQRPRLTPVGKGPVFFLMLDSECSYSVVCDVEPQKWNKDVPGWRVMERFDRFTLYGPAEDLRGRAGVIEATQDFGKAMTPRLGYWEYFLAARLLKLREQDQQAQAVIEQMYATAEPSVAAAIRDYAERKELVPFLLGARRRASAA